MKDAIRGSVSLSPMCSGGNPKRPNGCWLPPITGGPFLFAHGGVPHDESSIIGTQQICRYSHAPKRSCPASAVLSSLSAPEKKEQAHASFKKRRRSASRSCAPPGLGRSGHPAPAEGMANLSRSGLGESRAVRSEVGSSAHKLATKKPERLWLRSEYLNPRMGSS